MRIIYDFRQNGKTTNLIIRSSGTGYPIIVTKFDRKRRIEQQAIEMNLIIPEPIIINRADKIREALAGVHKKVLIDDADYFLGTILGIEIDTITMTTRDEEGNEVLKDNNGKAISANLLLKLGTRKERAKTRIINFISKL